MILLSGYTVFLVMVACQSDSYVTNSGLNSTSEALSPNDYTTAFFSTSATNETLSSSLPFSTLEIVAPLAIAETADILLLFLPMLLTLYLRTHWKAVRDRLLMKYTKTPPHKWNAETVSAWLELHLELPRAAEEAFRRKVTGNRIMFLADDNEFDEIFNITNSLHRKRIRLGVLVAENDWRGSYLDWMKRWTDARPATKGILPFKVFFTVNPFY